MDTSFLKKKETMHQGITQLATLLHRLYPDHPVETVVTQLPRFDIPFRKDLLSICRTQQDYRQNPRLHSALRATLARPHSSYRTHNTRHTIRYDKIVDIVTDFVKVSPIRSGFISVLLRSCPFLDIESIRTEWQEGVDKEFHATQQEDRPQVLNYSVWFGVNQVTRGALSVYLAPQRYLNLEIQKRLRDWRDSLEGRLLLPHFSDKKHIGRESGRNLAKAKGYTHEEDVTEMGKRTTTAALEKWWETSGTGVVGPAEMRTVWKFNDLKPRVYFAMGSTTYYSSRYVRKIFNTLANSFNPTHFLTRMNTSRIMPSDEDRVFIYDYTSFTSNMAEQKYFLDHLASFCDGTMVRVLDTHRGILNISLGSLIRGYNDDCNRLPAFSRERIEPGDESVYVHKIAGFLGVYGNITSCTILHGLHACQICGSLDRCNCVGDDAVIAQRREKDPSMKIAKDAINSIGTSHDKKFHIFEDGGLYPQRSGWQFIKRPLDRFINRLYVGELLDFPIFAYAYPYSDSFHISLEGNDAGKMIAVQTGRLFETIRLRFNDPTREEKDLILGYLHTLYFGLKFPYGGSLPTKEIIERHGPIYIPPLVYGVFEEPWIDILCHDAYGEVIRAPKFVLEEDGDVVPRSFKPGDQYVGRSVRELSFVGKLGYCSSSLVVLDRIVDDSYLRDSRDLLSGTAFLEYVVSFLVESPPWWEEFTSACVS